MRSRGRGTQSRYDRDFGPNQLQRERDYSQAPRLILPKLGRRFCHACKTKKSAKGGVGANTPGSFVCADCRGNPGQGKQKSPPTSPGVM